MAGPGLRRRNPRGSTGAGARGEWTTIGVTKVVKQALDEVLFDMRKRSYNALLTELIRLYWVSQFAEGGTKGEGPGGAPKKDKSRPE